MCVNTCGGAKDPFLMTHTALGPLSPIPGLSWTIHHPSQPLRQTWARGPALPRKPRSVTRQRTQDTVEEECHVEAARYPKQWRSVRAQPKPRPPSEAGVAAPTEWPPCGWWASVPGSMGPELWMGRSFQPGSPSHPQGPRAQDHWKEAPQHCSTGGGGGGHRGQSDFGLWVWRPAP